MLRPRVFSKRTVGEAALLCMILILGSRASNAQTNDGEYILIVASGFLCEPGDTTKCPATAKSNQGDSYELSGAGTFDAQSKSAKAAGTFTHKSPNGNVLETGVWLAGELVSFDSYGAAPNALPRQGAGFGPRPMAPRRTPLQLRPMPIGGLAVIRIRLVPIQGPATNAVLEVNCTLGEVPRERSVEGIRLKLEKNNAEYSEETGGRVMILALRPGVTPAKAPQPETPTESPEPPQN
ncbi:MAG TPA: hypothetical protein VEI54_06520 [Candidatus Limnocylindrales bacterium]|nr:hypothetical protein [Candidatus Limnocylindrales bacterium]